MIAALAYMVAGGLLVICGVVIGSNLVTRGAAFPSLPGKTRVHTSDDRE